MQVHRNVGNVAAEWEQLAERAGAPPFMRPGWFAAFERAFGGGLWEIACVRRDGRLAAVLPLQRRGNVLAGAANWHTPGFGAVAEDAEAVSELVDALLEAPPRRLDLSFLPPDDHLLEALRERIEIDDLHALERVVERSPYVEVSGSWEDFLASVPGKRRAELRRRRRRLDELGRIAVGPEPADTDLAARLAEVFEVEALGWKGSAGTAIASDPTTVQFYEEIADWASARNWLRLWFLRLDDRPLAVAYCLVHGGVQYVLKVGFDPEYRRFAPGILLTREMLVHAFESGLTRFEFLGTADPYKLLWTDRCHDMTRLQLFSDSPAGLASRALWEFGRPVARFVVDTARSRTSA